TAQRKDNSQHEPPFSRLRGRIRVSCTILTTQLPCNGWCAAYSRRRCDIVTAPAPLFAARNAGPDRQAMGISVMNPAQVPNPHPARGWLKRRSARGQHALVGLALVLGI